MPIDADHLEKTIYFCTDEHSLCTAITMCRELATSAQLQMSIGDTRGFSCSVDAIVPAGAIGLSGRKRQPFNHPHQLSEGVGLHLPHSISAMNLHRYFTYSNVSRDLLVQ